MQNLIGASFVQNPVQHVVSAATISGGAAVNLTTSAPVGLWDSVISVCADLGIVAGLFLTCFLIYRAWRADQKDNLQRELLRIEIAEKGRRGVDRGA